MTRGIAIAALCLSIIACALAAWRHVDHTQAAREAMRQREAELLAHYTPMFRQIAADFDIADYPENPQTLEEAFDPIVRMVESVSPTD